MSLLIYDIKLQENGSIYYNDPSDISNFSNHLPGYFGDIMTVNGRSWPYMNVQNKMYRLKISNLCNSRYLNLYFQPDYANTTYSNDSSNLPFYVIKKDAGYLTSPILRKAELISPFARLEIIIDFNGVVGNVTLRTDANKPMPRGD